MRNVLRGSWGGLAAAVVLLVFVCAVSAAAQAGKKGVFRSITINTHPNAKVWINGVLYGSASETGAIVIKTVSPGRKTVRVRADGFAEAQKVLLPAQSGAIDIPLAETTDKAELVFQEAERLASVDRQKAMAKYDEAIKLRPSYMDAFIGLARVQLDASEYEKANKTLAAAKRAKPGLPEVSVIEGRVLKNFGEEEKAVAAFKRAIREGNGFMPEAYAGLGLLFKEKAEGAGAAGDYVKEKAYYSEAARNLSLAIDQLSGAPDAVTMYQLLGLVYEDQKQPEKAIAVYEEFLKYFPDHLEAETFRSFIVQLKKQSSESQ